MHLKVQEYLYSASYCMSLTEKLLPQESVKNNHICST